MDPERSSARTQYSAAFTVIECIAVVAILSLLMALLLPVLGSVRSSARVALCLSNIRQSATDLAQYAEANRDLMPALTLTVTPMSGREPRGRLYCPSGWIEAPYFGGSRWWSACLAVALDEQSDSWSCPKTPRAPGVDPSFGADPIAWQVCGRSLPPSSYSYSAAFTAAPAFWQDDPSVQTLDKLVAQRLSSTTYPAGKVLLFEGITVHASGRGQQTWDLPNPVSTIAFADLRAEERDFRTARPGVANRFNPGAIPVMLNTRDGVAGRDF